MNIDDYPVIGRSTLQDGWLYYRTDLKQLKRSGREIPYYLCTFFMFNEHHNLFIYVPIDNPTEFRIAKWPYPPGDPKKGARPVTIATCDTLDAAKIAYKMLLVSEGNSNEL
jgi:hypothetical protein